MEISPIQPKVNASDLPLNRIADNPHVTKEEKIAEVSRQFEAILLRQILSTAQKPLFHTEYEGNSVAASIYRDMISTQIADNISKSDVVGLAQSISHQLIHQLQTPISKDIKS